MENKRRSRGKCRLPLVTFTSLLYSGGPFFWSLLKVRFYLNFSSFARNIGFYFLEFYSLRICLFVVVVVVVDGFTTCANVNPRAYKGRVGGLDASLVRFLLNFSKTNDQLHLSFAGAVCISVGHILTQVW